MSDKLTVIVPLKSIPGVVMRVTPWGDLRLEGNAGSCFDFHAIEARAIHDWLGRALTASDAEVEP